MQAATGVAPAAAPAAAVAAAAATANLPAIGGAAAQAWPGRRHPTFGEGERQTVLHCLHKHHTLRQRDFVMGWPRVLCLEGFGSGWSNWVSGNEGLICVHFKGRPELHLTLLTAYVKILC